jgi:hypothetical protein
MSNSFLAVGDYLFNPELLAYAIVDNDRAEPGLRLVFASNSPDAGGEVRLAGDEAREVLRWLRLNATYLTRGGGFGTIGRSAEPAVDRESQRNPGKPRATICHSWDR